jgi:NO-binding membrane sensor protein with MHYT domain
VDWKQLDFPTRAGLVATVMAVLGALIPPVSVMSALVAIAFSGTALWRARRRGQSNRVARLCLVVSVVLVAVVVIGSAIYSSAN